MNFIPASIEEEDKNKKKRGRRPSPKMRKKHPPLAEGERDRLVNEYIEKGGKVTKCETVGMKPGLTYQHRMFHDKSVANQMPWLKEVSTQTKQEDIEFVER